MPKSRGRREKGAPPAGLLKIAEKMEEAIQGSGGRRALIDIAVGSHDTAGELRLPVLARDQLRRRLRKHPNIGRHVERVDAINQLPKADLLALAKKLGINAKAIIEHAIEHGRGIESVLEEEELDRWRYSHKRPAFKGHYPFEITFEVCGENAARQSRVHEHAGVGVFRYAETCSTYRLARHPHVNGDPDRARGVRRRRGA